MACKKYIAGLSFFLFFMVGPSVAQYDNRDKDIPETIFDTNYLADYTDLVTSRLYFLYQNASLLINHTDGEISKLVYRPNVNVRIGIAGFWKWFGLGISIDNPLYKTDRDAYGKTTTLDIRVNAFGRSFAGELFFQKYKGFYLGSPEKPDGSHYLVPDMRTISVGVAGYWVLNSKRFSIRAAFVQNERQKKSAGSLVVRPAILYYSIHSDRGIIPEEMIDRYHIPMENLIISGKFYSFELAPGYVYTLVFLKNIYLTAAVFPGVALQISEFSNKTTMDTKNEFTFQFNGRVALGYNSDKWFLGGSVQMGFNEVPDKLSNALFNYEVAQFRFWGGMRFNLFKMKTKVIAN